MTRTSRQFTTEGIVLARTNFGEADRILTFLTPDQGKVKAIAKTVRKSQSKLAGGIELFSISHLTLIVGRGEINTLISTRLKKHYGNIVKDMERTNAGYEFIRLINKNTEEEPEPGYFDLLKKSFVALDDGYLHTQLVNLWFNMQLLKLTGHAPNLHTDSGGTKLAVSVTYDFHIEQMHFVPEPKERGSYSADHIKFMRVGFGASSPRILQRINHASKLTDVTSPLIQTMLKSFLRV